MWSVHPSYLDAAGLNGAWREGLLAKAVLEGRTKSYKNHPQLIRFRGNPKLINNYLYHLWAEGKCRGYNYDKNKIGSLVEDGRIKVSLGQIVYEALHLLGKLWSRDNRDSRDKFWELQFEQLNLKSHPLFTIERCNLKIENWERAK